MYDNRSLCIFICCFRGYSCVFSTMLVCYHLFCDWWIPIAIFVVRFVCLMFGFEPRVFLKAASLSIWIEVRFVYISPSPDSTNGFAICVTYWVRLLFLFIILVRF
ncbi:hypothetical protein Hanom_Chr01g00073201 [Helianthus anomalus]